MKGHVFRLEPGQDLRRAIEEFVARARISAGVILTCVGSLKGVVLRPAGAADTLRIDEEFEIVSLVGTVSTNGCHLHVSVSDPLGVTMGGHLLEGSLIRTTAEIVIGELEDTTFTRVLDPRTGFKELVIQ
jgi:predicted DNA-binding protein with PD1-like motif